MKNNYWTYVCAGGEGCTDDREHPHVLLVDLEAFGCKFMPIFETKEEAEEALKEAGKDISRIRKITL